MPATAVGTASPMCTRLHKVTACFVEEGDAGNVIDADDDEAEKDAESKDESPPVSDDELEAPEAGSPVPSDCDTLPGRIVPNVTWVFTALILTSLLPPTPLEVLLANPPDCCCEVSADVIVVGQNRVRGAAQRVLLLLLVPAPPMAILKAPRSRCSTTDFRASC